MTLITGFGADKTMTAVISGEADIGFMGAEASIYAYQEGATDPVVNFAPVSYTHLDVYKRQITAASYSTKGKGQVLFCKRSDTRT